MTRRWKARAEGGDGSGQTVAYQSLRLAIADGHLGEEVEVFDPRRQQWALIGDHAELEKLLPRKPLFPGGPAEDEDPDMTPMIDATFQLLIFFMIAASFAVQKTLDMPLSDAKSEGATAVTLEQLKQQNVYVTVSREGTIKVQDRPTPLAELAKAMTDAMQGLDNPEVALDVADEVKHDLVVQVIDAAAAARAEKIHFVSHVPARSPPGTGSEPEP